VDLVLFFTAQHVKRKKIEPHLERYRLLIKKK